jgi:hypothetical protein
VLIGLEKELVSPIAEYDGDLLKLYQRVQKLLNLRPDRKDVSNAHRQVLSGLISVVKGYNQMLCME